MTDSNLYLPSDAERSAGKWAVLHESWSKANGPDYESTAHVMPTFGVPHVISGECWCGPQALPRKDGSIFYVHEASQ